MKNIIVSLIVSLACVGLAGCDIKASNVVPMKAPPSPVPGTNVGSDPKLPEQLSGWSYHLFAGQDRIAAYQFNAGGDVIQVSVFQGDSDHALFTFAAYVRAAVRFINDKRGRYLEIADCIIAPNRFWYIESGDPFDRERFPIAVNITVAIDPDIRIAFVNCEPRT